MASRRTRAANGRSSIYETNDGWHGWVSMGDGPDGRSVRRHVRGKTRAAVTQRVRALEKARDEGAGAVLTPRVTLAAYLEDWIDAKVRLAAVRPKTVEGYRTDLARIRSTIGHIQLGKLEARNIEHLWATMVADGVLASVQHCRRTLKAAIADAVSKGLLTRNVVNDAKTPPYHASEIEPYTVEQATALLRAAAGRRNAVRWTLALALGLRRGEVLGLQWPDVDLDEGVLTVRRQLQRVPWEHGCSDPSTCGSAHTCPMRYGGGLRTSEPKSAAGRRIVALPDPLVAELRAHRTAQAAERMAAPAWLGDWVIATEVGGPIDPRNDARLFTALCQRANVPERRLHDLRHTAATIMLLADVDLATAGAMLGHSRVEMTRRYTHVLADRQRVAADRIDGLLWKAQDRAK